MFLCLGFDFDVKGKKKLSPAFVYLCRCGHEFCYNCGAEWKNKKATCSCPLWDEDNILDNDSDSSFEEDDDDDEYESEFESEEEFI